MPVLILIIGIVIIILSSISLKKYNKEKKNNSPFDMILQTNKEELNDYKYELGILRKDIGESLAELQNDIIQIKEEINYIKDKKQVIDNKTDELYINNEFEMTEKAKSIKELLDNGISNEEICRRLDVSKGEVLLVAGLYKK